MPKSTLKQEFPMHTRNDFTNVDCEISISIDGRELPSLSVLGDALEAARELIQAKVTESYKVVPARV